MASATRFLAGPAASVAATAARACLALVLLLAVEAVEAVEAACPPRDSPGAVRYLPHPRDCAMFLRCHQGREVPGHCPAGSAFVRQEGACGDPGRSSCTACSPGHTCEYWCSCAIGSHQPSCPAGAGFTALMHAWAPGCRTEEGSFPLLGGRLGRVDLVRAAGPAINVRHCADGETADRPHFADCSKVMVCEAGRRVVTECPDGLFFDHATGFCDEPGYVNCSTPGRAPAPARLPGEVCGEPVATCNYSCDCPATHGLQGDCPPRLHTQFRLSIHDSDKDPSCLQVKGVTNLGENYVAIGSLEGNSTSASHCAPSDGKPTYFAHPTDCESFIVCFRGSQSVRRCPAGRQYNPATQRCGDPDVSLCVSAPSSLSAPSSSLRCPTSWVCSAAYKGVPHISDCTLFCRCDGARPVLAACPPGTHFSPRSQTCEDPAVARCRPTCAQLGNLNGSGGQDRGMWQPESCVDTDSRLGAKCRLKCFPKYVLDGSVRVRCTRQGWASNAVLNIIPACRTPEEIGSSLVSKINESLADVGRARTEMLFIIDDAGRVDSRHFEMQKRLVATIVRAFPLSQQRLAGVATLSSESRVYIRLVQASTCDFLSELRSVGRSRPSSRGGSDKRLPDITRILGAVADDIDQRGSTSRALIFLVTSKRSSSQPLAAAEQLKEGRHLLFTVGVGKFNRKLLNLSSSRHKDGSKLFFGLPSTRLAKSMIAHISREYSNEESNYCY